jgi:hypothetical protein
MDGLFALYDMQKAEQFYLLLTKQVSVTDFEQWVYNTSELEAMLSADHYLALISLNYRSRWAFHELQKIVSSYVNWSEVRQQELVKALQTIVLGKAADDVLAAFSQTYHWYCHGYSFLQNIAFSFLSADNDFLWDPEGEWAKLTERQKQQYISRFYPAAQQMAQRLIHQLESGKIQLHTQGLDDEITYTETGVAATTEELESLQKQAPAAKQWWQLWQ